MNFPIVVGDVTQTYGEPDKVTLQVRPTPVRPPTSSYTHVYTNRLYTLIHVCVTPGAFLH